jgi:hypothetical protein
MMLAAAASTYCMSIRFSAVIGVGTAMMNTSASSGRLVVRSFPDFTAASSKVLRPGS